MKVYFSISILTTFCLPSYMTTYHQGKHVKCTKHHSSNLLKSIFLELHSFLAKWIFLCLIQLLKLNFQIYRMSIHKPCWNSETLIFAFQICFVRFLQNSKKWSQTKFRGNKLKHFIILRVITTDINYGLLFSRYRVVSSM